MTDYFALLRQPRRPWLDPDELKGAFHGRARTEHPDAAAVADSGSAFAELNEAYQTLQDPKRRLKHLLDLSGHSPAREPSAIPAQVAELFPAVAALTHSADGLVEQTQNATSTLSRSLLKQRCTSTNAELDAIAHRLSALHAKALARLQEIDHAWLELAVQPWDQLRQLYLELSYLTRWRAELQERKLQLSTC